MASLLAVFKKFKSRLSQSAAIIQSMTTPSGKISVNPLSEDPVEAWNKLKLINRVEKVEPMSLDTLISPDKVRFVCVSDTHSRISRMHYPIPNGDVFIHAGDFSNMGAAFEVKQFNEFLGSLPHAHKIVVAGNHELSFDPLASVSEKFKDPANIKRYRKKYLIPDDEEWPPVNPQELLTNCTYLQDSGVKIYGLRIYGSPWQAWFRDWAFNAKRGTDCLTKWNMIPYGTDILITHGPPIGHGDLCDSGDRAGCVELLSTVQERVRPKFHVFGHVHEGYGITTNGTTTFINAAICTKSYSPSNPPIIFDVPLPPGLTK